MEKKINTSRYVGTNTMPESMKQAWMEALRSGDYEQGIGALKQTDGGYCCLGVLQMCVDGKVEVNKGTKVSLLSPSMEWLTERNITFLDFNNNPSRSPRIITDERVTDITRLNDNDQLSFKEIADIIDEHIEGI